MGRCGRWDVGVIGMGRCGRWGVGVIGMGRYGEVWEMRCGVGVIGMGRYGEVWEMRCGRWGVIGMGRYDEVLNWNVFSSVHVTLGSVVVTTSFPFVSHCCASGFEFRTFAWMRCLYLETTILYMPFIAELHTRFHSDTLYNINTSKSTHVPLLSFMWCLHWHIYCCWHISCHGIYLSGRFGDCHHNMWLLQPKKVLF